MGCYNNMFSLEINIFLQIEHLVIMEKSFFDSVHEGTRGLYMLDLDR